jgi:hypothetical protein
MGRSSDQERALAIARLAQFAAEPHGRWLVELFRALVPDTTSHYLPLDPDGVIAFVPLADVAPAELSIAVEDKISFHLHQDDRRFTCTAEVSDGCSGWVRMLFIVQAQLNPPEVFHVAKMVGHVKVGRTLTVGHTLKIREQVLGDGYGQWLVQIAWPAILKHCLDTGRFASTSRIGG